MEIKQEGLTPTLSQALELYIALRSLRPNTVEIYREKIALLISLIGEDKPIDQIDALAICKARDRILVDCKASTFNLVRRHWRSVFNFAVNEEWIKKSPINKVMPAPEISQPPRRISNAAVAQLLERLEENQMPTWGRPCQFWLAFISVLVSTGMRLGQIRGLNWGDVDFASKTILLRAITSKTHREWTIPLTSVAYGPLLELYEQVKQISTEHVEPEKAVFNISLFKVRNQRELRERMSESQIARFFRGIREDFHINMSCHRFRHTVGTEMMKRVRNPKIVQTLLGHRSLATTMIYVHVDVDAMREPLETYIPK
jgi:integrase